MVRVRLQIALAAGLVLSALSGGGCKKEGTSHGDGRTPALTRDDIAAAVELYVNAAVGNSKGYFLVFDEEAQKEVRLKPDGANREMVGKVADNMYFACVEFATAEGDVYDVDIFVTGESKNDLEFAELMIHGVNGQERYTWYRNGDLWKRKPVRGKTEEILETEEGLE